MNDSTPDKGNHRLPTVPTRTRANARTYRTALKDPGSSRLSAEDIDTVTKALVILENKVMRKLKPGEILSSPDRVKQWISLHYGMLDREVFGLVFLDARLRYLGHQQLFVGDISGASVHPRQVVRSVLEFNAAALICVHCHPSQVHDFSAADELISRRLKEILGLIDVRLLDHLLAAGNQVVSMAERGAL